MTVTNPYYEFAPEFTPGTKARSDAVNSQYQAIQNAFDFLPGDSDAITTGTSTFAPESGTGNVYVVTMPDARTAESDGDEVIFFATHTNTGAATLEVDGLGAKSIVRADGNAVTANDLQDGILYVLRYDATNTRYQLVGPSTSYLTDAAASAAASAVSAAAALVSENAAAASAVEAMQWAVNPEDDDVDSAPGQFSALHWAAKAQAAAGLQRIVADITTATPPTSEAVTAQLQYWDADETDQLAYVGYDTSSDFEIHNLMHGSHVVIRTEDSAGFARESFRADPDGLTSVYGQSNLSLYYGGTIGIEIEGQGVQTYHQGVKISRTVFPSAGGLDVYNELTSGNTSPDRVLTVSDWEAGQFKLVQRFNTNIATSDPGQGNFKFNNATMGSATEMYINDTSDNDLDNARVLSALAAGDILRIAATEDDGKWIVLEIGTPVDNTGWWTLPVTVLSSNGAFTVEDCIIDIQWNSTASALDDGTVANTSLKWNGSAWVENLLFRQLADRVAIYGTDDDNNTDVVLEFRNNSGTLRGEIGVGNQNADHVWNSFQNGADMRIRGRNAGGTARTGLDFSPDGAMEITGVTNIFLNTGTTGAVSGIDIATGVVLYYGDVVQLKTSSEGVQAVNPFNGEGGTVYERMLTESYQDWAGSTSLYRFDVSTSATDPGIGDIRFNSATPASVTTMYVDELSEYGNHNMDWLWQSVSVGDLIILRGVDSTARYWIGSISALPTDNTGWWTVPVTHIQSGSLPTSGELMNLSIQYVVGDATLADNETVTGDWVFTGLHALPPSGGESALAIDRLWINGKNTIVGSSTFLRLNQDDDYTAGIAMHGDAAMVDGEFITAASTTARPGLSIPEGVAPTSPADGDVWVTAAGAFNARLNGVTVDLSDTGGAGTIGGSITDNQVAVGNGTDAIDGSSSLTWDGTTFVVAGTIRGSNINAGAILNEAASATNPTLVPNRSDVNTGIGSNAGEQVSIICNGVEIVRVVDSGVNEYAEIKGTLFITEQSAAHTDISGDGQVWVRSGTPNELWFTDDTGDDFPIATGVARRLATNAAYDINTAGNEAYNGVCFYDNGTAYTITLGNSTGNGLTNMPVDASFQIISGGTGTITINEGTSTTLYLIESDGTVTDTAGGCTMAAGGGAATVYRASATVYYIWGGGITA